MVLEPREQKRAGAVGVDPQVPAGKRRARLADVDRPVRPDHGRVGVAVGDQLVAPQLSAVVAVLEHEPADLFAGEPVAPQAVGAGQALLDHLKPEPGPQRALGALVADDPREALERLAPRS